MAFEAILSQQRATPRRWVSIVWTFAILVHVVALAAGVAHSIWQVEELPLPAIEVTLAVAPPPPPPPPPPKRSSSKPRTKPAEVKPKAIVAPKETPQKEPEPEAAEEAGEEEEDEGEEGGQEGGVVGGVVGGIVGGTAPPPPKSTGPKILSEGAGHKLLAINPLVRPYKVNVDEELLERQDSFTAIINICVSAEGKVTGLKIVKGTIPPIDSQIRSVVPKWKYRPYMFEGKPAPFCYPLRYTVR